MPPLVLQHAGSPFGKIMPSIAIAFAVGESRRRFARCLARKRSIAS